MEYLLASLASFVVLLVYAPILAVIYWLATFVRLIFLPLHDEKFMMSGEAQLGAIRLISMKARERVILTNWRFCRTGNYRYGIAQKMEWLPVHAIDSVSVGTGRNIFWICVIVSEVLSTLIFWLIATQYASSLRNSSNDFNVSFVALVIRCAFWYLIYYLSGERILTVKSKTTVIRVRMTLWNTDWLARLMRAEETFVTKEIEFMQFCQKLQEVVWDSQGAVEPAAVGTKAVTIPGVCGACGHSNHSNSKFCEMCGGKL